MKNEQLELEAYLDNIKIELGAKATMHLSWAKSVYHLGYELSLAVGDKGVISSITELELASFKGSAKELAAQKIENMINSLQYKEDSSSWATGALVDHEPSVVKPGKPTAEPEAQSLDELYGATNWKDLLEKDTKSKAKSKKKPTAAELEFKYKHQLTEGTYLAAYEAELTEMLQFKLNKINKKLYEDGKKYKTEGSKISIPLIYEKLK